MDTMVHICAGYTRPTSELGTHTTESDRMEKDITIVNIYAPNIGTPQYIKQMLIAIEGEINSEIIILEDFNTPLTLMYKSSRQKIWKHKP